MVKQLLTHSRGASFKTCRRRHFWEYEVGLRRDVDAKALRIGSAGHDALDCLRKGKPIEDAVQTVRRHYAVCPCDPESWEYERETVESLVAGYHWRWSESQLKVVASEHAFQIPLTNPDTNAASRVWDLAGMIDGIVELEDGRLAVLETKFISEALDQEGPFWQRLQLDSQPSIYVHAARQLGFDVSTVLYDLVRKPTIYPSQVPVLDADGLKIVLDEHGERVLTKQGKPRQTGDTAKGYVLQTRTMRPDEWSQKLLDDIGERPEWYFARIEVARLNDDVQETRAELWELQQTIREAQLNDRWFKTVTHGTCSFCSFFGLCSSRYQPRESEIPEGFIRLASPHPELEGKLDCCTP